MFLRKWRCRVPLILLTCMFGGLCAVSGIVALPKLAARHVGGQESSLLSAAETADGAERPNVYYFLYDEYSGPESLRYYYGFDNSALYDQLEQRGFDCSGSSYNTESCATVSWFRISMPWAMMQRPFRAAMERCRISTGYFRTRDIRST